MTAPETLFDSELRPITDRDVMSNPPAAIPQVPGAVAPILGSELGVVLFNGMRFVEAKPIGHAPPNYACEGCAFVAHPELCAKAGDGAAKSAFGGDCDERDVIYVEAHTNPSGAW